MFPFIYVDHPDQFYRLISSLFLHAGLGHILFTLFFHWFIMRDLEKLAGPLRIAIIYLGCGIAGNLGSVLLDPHRAEVSKLFYTPFLVFLNLTTGTDQERYIWSASFVFPHKKTSCAEKRLNLDLCFVEFTKSAGSFNLFVAFSLFEVY